MVFKSKTLFLLPIFLQKHEKTFAKNLLKQIKYSKIANKKKETKKRKREKIEKRKETKMKFVHIADMHFDTKFDSLKEDLGEKRRLEQREIFNKMIEYIKKEQIPYLFISGDLYEQKYIRESTIEYINNKFKEIIDTKIYIAPGNHDPYLKNSYYNNYNWSKNVKIFNSKLEKISLEEADIYGYGFNDFYCNTTELEDFEIENKEKINILVMHATLDGSTNAENLYNPITTNLLKSKGFDYIALGHIHKNNIEKDNRIIYPGSMISMGFDELGEHGMVVCELTKEKLNMEFAKLDEKEFVEYELDITEINSKEELIETLNNTYIPENSLYKINLTGTRNFEINIPSIIKLIKNDQILKIKNHTKMKYNLEEISKEISLRGFYVKNLLEKQKSGEYVDKEIEKALEMGLEIL